MSFEDFKKKAKSENSKIENVTNSSKSNNAFSKFKDKALGIEVPEERNLVNDVNELTRNIKKLYLEEQYNNQNNKSNLLDEIKLRNNAGDTVSSDEMQKVKDRLAFDKKIEDQYHTKENLVTKILFAPLDYGDKIIKPPENLKDNARRFEDGYQFGDVSKTALETVGDIATSAGATAVDLASRPIKGFLSVAEGMSKLGASGIAGIADIAGADDFANKVRRNVAYLNPITGGNEKLEKVVNPYTALGSLSESALEGVGQSVGYLSTSKLLSFGGLSSEIPITVNGRTILKMPVTALLSGAGSSASEAYRRADEQLGIENLTWRNKVQNVAQIVGGGTIEGISEGIFGLFGVGGSEITDVIANKAVEKASTAFGKQAMKILVAGGGEALEEFFSYAGTWLWDNHFVNKLGEIDYSQNWDWNEVMEEMASAFLSAGISEGGNSSVRINQIYNNVIKESQKTGTTLTDKQKADIKAQISDLVLHIDEKVEESTTDEITLPKLLKEQVAKWKAQKQQKNDTQKQLPSLSKEQVNTWKKAQNIVQNDKNLTLKETEGEYNTIPKNIKDLKNDYEEIKNFAKSRITPEIQDDIRIFVNNATDEFNSVESDEVDTEAEELAKKILSKEELDWLYDSDREDWDWDLQNEVFNVMVDLYGDELDKHNYKFDTDTNAYVPDAEKLKNSDEIFLKYNELPNNDFEFAQLEKIRDEIDDLAWNIKKELPDNIDITVEESRSSADATYITISNEETNEEYKIRVGNHYKGGVSGEADSHIKISDFDTISKLIEKLKNEIYDGLESLDVDIKQKNSYNRESQYATVAPYRLHPVTESTYEESVSAVEKNFLNSANSLANQLGIKINNVSNNMGGFVSQQGEYKGKFVNEVSYTFELGDATKEQADLFASVLGDIGFETQEAVISSNYTKKGDKNANALEIRLNVNDVEGLARALEKCRNKRVHNR